jgi:hypothetical protein
VIRLVMRQLPSGMMWALVVGCAIYATRCATERVAEREANKERDRILTHADSLKQESDSLRVLADSIAPLRDSLRIIRTQKQKVVVQRIADARTQPVPPSCDTACLRLVSGRDSIIDDQNELLVIQGREIRLGREIEAKLRGALSASNMRADSLLYLTSLPRPKAPRATVGIFVGPCVTQTGAFPFCAGVGVSWRIL